MYLNILKVGMLLNLRILYPRPSQFGHCEFLIIENK